jgi:zinc transport system substrate-binding protein
MDPHTWLAPPLAKIHIRNILQGLIEADPLKKADFEINYQSLLKEIEEVDAELQGLFSGSGKNVKFMVFHPAWGYFAKTYGLTQISVEMEGKEPKPADLERLIRHAKEEQIKVIFVQRQFSTKSAEAIAQNIGGTISVTDPMAFDWSENLRETAKKFREALR